MYNWVIKYQTTTVATNTVLNTVQIFVQINASKVIDFGSIFGGSHTYESGQLLISKVNCSNMGVTKQSAYFLLCKICGHKFHGNWLLVEFNNFSKDTNYV